MSIDFSTRQFEVHEPAGNTEAWWFRRLAPHDTRKFEVHEPAGDTEARWFRGSLPVSLLSSPGLVFAGVGTRRIFYLCYRAVGTRLAHSTIS